MYNEIVEVVEGGKILANHYLETGYRLLDIQTSTRYQMFPADAKGMTTSHFVRKHPIYILGRTKYVDHADPPPWRDAPKREVPKDG